MTNPSHPPTALVTGANRGIGLEVARQLAQLIPVHPEPVEGRVTQSPFSSGFHVYLGAREAAKGEAAAAALCAEGLRVTAVHLDVTGDASIAATVARLQTEHGRLDVLVNNAATNYDTWQDVLTADLAQVRDTLDTNTLGPWRVTLAFLPLLRLSAHPRVVNVSSGAGALDSMTGGTPAYSLSKLATNGLTKMIANRLRHDGILVNAVCPGWVATDMGGPGGRPIPEGAAGIVWAATLPDNGPTGGFYRDALPIDF